MAIRQTKSDNLVETKLVDKENDVLTSKESDSDSGVKTLVKKRGFLLSTIDELRKVEWPTFKYTANWSAVIIVFTFIFSLSIGFIDNIFQSGIKYVSCTADNQVTEKSSEDKSVKFGECNTDLVKNLSFRK